MAPPLAQELRTKEAEAMCEVDPIIRPPCRDYPFPIPISMSDQTTNDEQAGYAAEPKGLIPSPNLPGVSYNAEGMPVNKDGKPIHDLVPMVSCGSDGCVDGKTTSGESCQNCGGRGVEPPKGPSEPSPRIRYAKGTTEPKRGPRPLLDELMEILADNSMMEECYPEIIGEVKAKIASGELRVVKTVNMSQECSECGWWLLIDMQQATQENRLSFCPGCGAKIVEA